MSKTLMATTEVVKGNRLLVTPKEGVEMTVLKGSSHFISPAREMYEKNLFLLTTSSFGQLVWWTDTEIIIVATVTFNGDAVNVDILHPQYFSKQKVHMLNCVKTIEHWKIAIKTLTKRFSSTLQGITLKLEGACKGYNSYLYFEATFRTVADVAKVYLRASRKFPNRFREFFEKYRDDFAKKEVKVNFWKLNHTQLTEYGVTKKDFDYYAKSLAEVAMFVKAEEPTKKVLAQKYPFFRFGTDIELKELANSCREYLANPTVGSNPSHISVNYSSWCGNTGYGVYINGNEFKKYHWINGAFLKTSAIANTHAIRYPISMSKEEVIAHAMKVVCRHCRRFLKEYSNL